MIVSTVSVLLWVTRRFCPVVEQRRAAAVEACWAVALAGPVGEADAGTVASAALPVASAAQTAAMAASRLIIGCWFPSTHRGRVAPELFALAGRVGLGETEPVATITVIAGPDPEPVIAFGGHVVEPVRHFDDLSRCRVRRPRPRRVLEWLAELRAAPGDPKGDDGGDGQQVPDPDRDRLAQDSGGVGS